MDEEAVLIVVANGQDEDGYAVEEETEYPVLVLQERSVTYNERYLASGFGAGMVEHVGVIPKIILRLRREDWELTRHVNQAGKKEYASRIRYDGDVYDIIREYHSGKPYVELTCG